MMNLGRKHGKFQRMRSKFDEQNNSKAIKLQMSYVYQMWKSSTDEEEESFSRPPTLPASALLFQEVFPFSVENEGEQSESQID